MNWGPGSVVDPKQEREPTVWTARLTCGHSATVTIEQKRESNDAQLCPVCAWPQPVALWANT